MGDPAVNHRNDQDQDYGVDTTETRSIIASEEGKQAKKSKNPPRRDKRKQNLPQTSTRLEMKFNENEMLEFVTRRKADIEGRLQHRSSSNSGFRERFFKLVGNLLFYYKISEWSQIESQPAGVIVLENYSVRPDSSHSLPFAFELCFYDESEKRHVFTTRTEYDMLTWIRILQKSSYQYWKQQFDLLSSKIDNASQQKLVPSLQNPQNRINPFQSIILPELVSRLPPSRPIEPSPSSQSRASDDLISF